MCDDLICQSSSLIFGSLQFFLLQDSKSSLTFDSDSPVSQTFHQLARDSQDGRLKMEDTVNRLNLKRIKSTRYKRSGILTAMLTDCFPAPN